MTPVRTIGLLATVCAGIILILSSAQTPQVRTVRVAQNLIRESCQVPDALKLQASVTGYMIDLKIDNQTGQVWRLDWNACSVSEAPSGWQSRLVDGNSTYQNKNDVKPPLVISPGFLQTQMFPAELLNWNQTTGIYWKYWPIPDGGDFRITLGFRSPDDKLYFCLLTGTLGHQLI